MLGPIMLEQLPLGLALRIRNVPGIFVPRLELFVHFRWYT
jgi:hypothetical protein